MHCAAGRSAAAADIQSLTHAKTTHGQIAVLRQLTPPLQAMNIQIPNKHFHCGTGATGRFQHMLFI
jgi:hypothetical protein